MDRAALTLPDFSAMTLDDAKRAFNEWVDTTWDFNKKVPAFKRDVAQMDSVKKIHKLAMNAVASGLTMKARSLK